MDRCTTHSSTLHVALAMERILRSLPDIRPGSLITELEVDEQQALRCCCHAAKATLLSWWVKPGTRLDATRPGTNVINLNQENGTIAAHVDAELDGSIFESAPTSKS